MKDSEEGDRESTLSTLRSSYLGGTQGALSTVGYVMTSEGQAQRWESLAKEGEFRDSRKDNEGGKGFSQTLKWVLCTWLSLPPHWPLTS